MALINFIDLNRATYITPTKKKDRFDFVSARYKNMRWLLRHTETYEVTASDTANLPGIAFRVYGDVGYWWILGMYNGIIDPVADIRPPLTLGIPSLSSINTFLSEGQMNLESKTNNTVTI
jgi:hypothetical protein